MELYTASHQWANRPKDERFQSLKDLGDFVRGIEQGTKIVDVDPNHFRTDVQGREIVALGQRNVPSKFSYTGFGHLAGAVDFSANELRKLNDAPTLVSNILNNRIKARQSQLNGWKMVMYQNGDIRTRAFVSADYGFINNAVVVDRLQLQRGWRVPPARPAGELPEGVEHMTAEELAAHGLRRATKEDLLADSSFGLSIREGDLIAPAGLYASWDDMFIFMVNENRRLNSGLARGIFVWNNSVKRRRFEVTEFFYNSVCGNHIVWGASGVKKNKIIHLGDKAEVKAIRSVEDALRAAGERSAAQDEQMIVRAQNHLLGATDEEVVEFVATKHEFTTQRNVLAALQLAAEHPEDHGNSSPRSVWGLVNGLTRLSQTFGFADARTELDLAAGKVLEVVQEAF